MGMPTYHWILPSSGVIGRHDGVGVVATLSLNMNTDNRRERGGGEFVNIQNSSKQILYNVHIWYFSFNFGEKTGRLSAEASKKFFGHRIAEILQYKRYNTNSEKSGFSPC